MLNDDIDLRQSARRNMVLNRMMKDTIRAGINTVMKDVHNISAFQPSTGAGPRGEHTG